jgi:DNA-directed RNA polymerase subunit RPC12/RpoP
LSGVAGGEDDEAGQSKDRRRLVPTGLIPVVIIAIGFVVQFFVQRNVLTRYDYQCGNCGATFSPTALSLALAPHRPGGRKYMRCPQCGRWSWVAPVPKG